MQKPSSKKPIIIFIVLAIVAALTYFYFSGSVVDNTSTLESSETPYSDPQVGFRVLTLLNQISAVKINTAIFDSPVYRSLVDHTVEVRAQNVGRSNPFSSAFSSPPAPKKR